MNLFIKTMADYIKEEWTRTLSSLDATKEVRLLTESLDPESTLLLLESLEQYRTQLANEGKKIECYFRVATNLWHAWQSNSTEYTQVQAKLESNQYHWIDKDNKLTWYRNRTLEAGYDALVIVLVGFNHASDQGGLADFHLVDEAKLWNYKLKKSFSLWIEEINQDLGLQLTDSQQEQIDSVIIELFKVRPRRLGKLAEYLQAHVIADNGLSQADAILQAFYAQLPFWDLPPIFTTNTASSKMTDAIKTAGEFMSHQFLKTAFEQGKVWQKIEKAIDDEEKKQTDGFIVPETLAGIEAYVDKSDYINTLHQFIFEADSLAKQRLLGTDFAWLFSVLKRPLKGPKASKGTICKLSGLSIDIVLEAVWLSLNGFYKNVQPYDARINSINIEVELFAHDMEDNADEGFNGDDLARELLHGCLGGLNVALRKMSLSAPIDEDQAKLPMDDWGHQIAINFEFDARTIKLKTHRQKPYVQFRVVLISDDEDLLNESQSKALETAYMWIFDSHHPERVRYLCAKEVWSQWKKATPTPYFLPAFELPKTQMTALYYAADEDEANRLALLVLGDISLTNLVADIEDQLSAMDFNLLDKLRELTESYKAWLSRYCKDGYYSATHDDFLSIISSYTCLIDAVLNQGNNKELLSRLYKAFLVFDGCSHTNQDYLSASVAWGITPAVLDLTHARFVFLRNGFSEAIGLLMLGKSKLAETTFFRLLNLVEIRRPLAGLVVDSQKSISVSNKSYGFIHWFGEQPSTEKSLAVQMLLREEESDDDINVTDFFKPNKDSEIVERVLTDYVKLHAFAHDGIRILAVNVSNLNTVLSGVSS